MKHATRSDYYKSVIAETGINKQSDLSHHILEAGELTREWKQQLLAVGLAQELRAILKKGNIENGATDAQLEMWPKAHRTLIADINRQRVFVPSVGCYVPVTPDRLTPEQATEAGKFLLATAEDTARVGRSLVALGRKRW